MSISAFGERYVSDAFRPFLFLSHTAPPPAYPGFVDAPTSTLWSRYYTAGWDDVFFFVGWSTILVLVRALCIGLFKSFALWWLDDSGNPALSLNGFVETTKPKAKSLKSGVHEANGVATAVAVSNGNGIANGAAANGNGHAKENGVGESQLRSRSSKPVPLPVSNALPRKSRAERIAAKKAASRERTATRFAEQGAVFVYYTFAWCFGVWVNLYMYDDAFLDTAAYWVNFPNTPVPGPVKFYYFLAFAFYGTAMVILNIEEHRKDHWQMFSHHIITVALIGVSWVTHISRPGIQILVLLDWCDIFLPLAKMTKYLNLPYAPDILFVVFLVSWFVTRQVLLLKIIFSVTFDMPRELSLEYDPSRGLYITKRFWFFYPVALWLLYTLLCVWFFMGCKVAWNVVKGGQAEEPRSEGEEDDEVISSSPSSSKED